MLVYTPGCWDLLHVGHIRFLQQSRELGELLYVGVASDEVIERDKGEPPIIPLEERIECLNALECVTLATPYHELEFIHHLTIYNPSVFVIGEYWGNEERHIDAELWCQESGTTVKQISYTSITATTEIKNRILEREGTKDAQNRRISNPKSS